MDDKKLTRFAFKAGVGVEIARMRETRLSDEARVLARELLTQHEQKCRAFEVQAPLSVTDGMINQSIIAYGDLCSRAGVPFLTHGVGQFLGEIAEWCNGSGWPALNALAVNRETKMPGDGYDEAAGCTILTWPDEVRKCIAFRDYPPATSL